MDIKYCINRIFTYENRNIDCKFCEQNRKTYQRMGHQLQLKVKSFPKILTISIGRFNNLNQKKENPIMIRKELKFDARTL